MDPSKSITAPLAWSLPIDGRLSRTGVCGYPLDLHDLLPRRSGSAHSMFDPRDIAWVLSAITMAAAV